MKNQEKTTFFEKIKESFKSQIEKRRKKRENINKRKSLPMSRKDKKRWEAIKSAQKKAAAEVLRINGRDDIFLF